MPAPAAGVTLRVPSPPSLRVRRRRLGQRGFSLVELSVVVTITGILATLATYSVRERVYEAHSVEAVAMLGNIRSGLLAKSDKLTGNSANVLQVGGRVGGFGGPLGLPGVLGAPDNGNGNGSDNGGGNADDIDGDGDRGHGNNDTRCDPDNPGAKGGADCGGGDDSGGDDSGGGNGSNGDGSNGDGNGPNGGGSGSADVDGDTTLCGSAAPVPASLDSVKGAAYQSSPTDWQGRDGWSCLSVSMSAAQRFQYGYDMGSTAAPASEAPSGAEATFAAWARGDLDGDGRTSWFVLNGASLGGQVVMAPALTIIDQGE